MTNKQESQKTNTRREKLAGYFFDLSKLVFAGLVVGGISPILLNNTDTIHWTSVFTGGFATYIFAFYANRILKQ